MIVVHDIFICKPGNASKVAKMFKETMGGGENIIHILTDLSGQYHRVVMVSEYENLAEFENKMEEMMNPKKETPEMKKMNEKMKGFQDMYTSGSREIYRVW